MENAKIIIKLITSFKSVEEFQKILTNLSEICDVNQNQYVCNILSLMAKGHLNTVKGAIFNEYFKEIMFKMMYQLKKDNDLINIEDYNTILNIINCERIFCENNKIPISMDHIDNILTILMEINIKKFIFDDIKDDNIFYLLHKNMSELCLSLIKYRHKLLIDRIPQFIYVYKDLLQSLCWYKSERDKNNKINEEELNNLEELAIKLENLMHLISSHSSKEIKRIAPYLLTFTINLMISSKKPITLYPKIKSRIENICFDLISVCDHRVGSFILRCSNDATKQIYETLRKDYQKYKFKGKI